MTPKCMIDVLIPAYNCEKFITKCLDSLFMQTYKNINIIVADDGSTDGTHDILESYKVHHKNISVYFKQNEQNISKTRNFLLSKIQSDYFTFFDADDYAEPKYIEELITNLIIYNSDISMCKKVRHHEKRKVKIIINSSKKLYFLSRNEALTEMISSNLYNGTVYCKLFKTKLIQGIRFDENIHYGEDLDFCFKIMQNCQKFIFSSKKLYHYIIRKNSIVTSKFKPNKLTCLDCYDIIINKTKDYNISRCAKSMKALIATELLFYIWRDRFKNKTIKRQLKKIIKNNSPFIHQNKNLPTILKLSPFVLWLTKFM